MKISLPPTPSELERSVAEVLQRFNQVFLSHDPSALWDMVAEDCLLENTGPAPEGARYDGREACVALWTQIATAPGTYFVPEDLIIRGDRGIILWRYHWGQDPGSSVRGVNLMCVREGRIVEALGYVKAG